MLFPKPTNDLVRLAFITASLSLALNYSAILSAAPTIQPFQFASYQDTGNLGDPTFDPYENSGAPRPPAFGDGDNGLGSAPGRPWFGPEYTEPRDPPSNSLFSGNLFGQNRRSTVLDIFRFAETPQMQYAWIPDGSSGNSVSMGEFDVAVVFAFPNFLQTEQPIYVAPSFGLAMFEGPRSEELPGQAYSGFLDIQWTSDPTQRFYADIGIAVGIHSDFDTLTTDSLRLTGHALANISLEENTTLKFGVMYFDRVDIKLLPAFGVFWNPHPEIRIDLFFPRPRMSQYYTSINNFDVWWYVGGEYGGGSWTMKRNGVGSTQVDINDLRLVTGFEFGLAEQLRLGRHIGFIEAGIVFDREVIYRNTPGDNFSPGTTVMLRAGLGY
jgi:hypothetical protein